MAKLIMCASKHGMTITYRCKSIYAKYKGRKCKEYKTNTCMSCDLCVAEMQAYDANKLLNSFGTKITRQRDENERR